MNLQQQTRALLDLVECDRAQRTALIVGEAERRAATLWTQACADARVLVRQAFAEQRLRRQQRVAEAQAHLATQRRLHEQQRHAVLLQRAWLQLPAALASRWREPAARAAWVAQVLNAARTHLPCGAWRIVHAADWPAPERDVLTATLGPGHQELHFEADPVVRAGLKVVAGGNLVDGTLDGLLADRSAIEARLLRELECRP